jgi:fused signal recognition particle receptor
MTLAIIGAVLALIGLLALRRRSQKRSGYQPTPPRAAMPSVLVNEVGERPSLTGLGSKLGTSRGVFDRLRTLSGAPTRETLSVVEEVLLRSDVGVALTAEILASLGEMNSGLSVLEHVRNSLLSNLSHDRSVKTTAAADHVPVWLFVGVNGVGKTTTIGKLAQQQQRAGRKVLLAAGDTFRAAASEQLTQWAERTGADIVRASEGADPGSVIHDALGRAHAKRLDLVLADTAGRRANSTNLLDELAKVRRIADRTPGEVVETFLVLDATTGQNALAQAKEFLASAGVTGIVLTKLDGTARGGIVVAIERQLGIPVKYIGVGEGVNDLMAFEPVAFVDSLLGA